MKKMKWIYVIPFAFLLTNCVTFMQSYQMDNKMKNIELGMTSEGSVETISYKTYTLSDNNTEGYYLLSFKDGKLVEWFKEKHPVHNHRH